MLDLNTTAPDFMLPTATGTPFTLRQHRGRPVVLYFYPKDDTSGCTAEACSFRDQYEDFLALGAEVVGVSMDNEASHHRFAQKHRLPFPLLADVGGKVRKLYQVPRMFGVLPMSGRVTYVIDGIGQIRYAFNSNAQPLKHVSDTLALLRELAREPGGAPTVMPA
ncbi:MAG: peroxiredoxin [Hymenobacteraceae bacterium]|nr:peroxiredoxin [Hymenobacteraceae bacterium]